MRKFTCTGITIIFLAFFNYIYAQKRSIKGIFVIYTKSQGCQVVKTEALFNDDGNFQLNRFCNGQKHNTTVRQGTWRYVNDSLLAVSFNNQHKLVFKILSDSLIELQNSSRFSKPKYRLEQTKQYMHKTVLFLLILLFGCHRIKNGVDRKAARLPDLQLQRLPGMQLHRYEQVPRHFKTYLDSLMGGKFSIANPGEYWASACTRLKDEPDKQLIAAAVSGDTLRMHYWQE